MYEASRARALLLGAGLTALLVVVALASRAASPFGGRVHSEGGPSHVFFDSAFTIVLLLGAALLFLYVFELLALPRRRPPRSYLYWLKSYLGFVLLMLALLAFARIAHGRRPPGLNGLFGQTSHVPARSGTSAAHRAGYAPHFSWALAGSLVALVLGSFAASAWLRRRRQGDALEPGVAAEGIAEDIDDALDDLRSERDPRRAIVAAYARMERSLGAHGFPRNPHEAPLEYVGRVLLALRVADGPVQRLTDLFELAKFGHRVPDGAMKDEAIEALVRIRDELRATP